MILTWWELPGPSAFVARIVSDLRRGASVQVCIPSCARSGLRSAVVRELSGGREIVLDTLEAFECTDPLQAITSLLGLEFEGAGPPSVRRLLASPLAQSRFLWISDIAERAWPAWQQFLDDFQAATRELDVDRRLQLILETPAPCRNACCQDVELTLHIYDGCITLTDCYLYAALLLQERDFAPIARELMVALVMRLGLWDAASLELLAQCQLGDVINPLRLLREIGAAEGWDADEEPAWARGTLAVIDGQKYVHSAWLALHEKESHIRRRIWQGQVQVLLPFVEERRQELLVTCAAVLHVPVTTNDGIIREVANLEIGHIEYQLSESRASVSLLEYVGTLKRIRNDLSHLRIVVARTLEARCLRDHFGATFLSV